GGDRAFARRRSGGARPRLEQGPPEESRAGEPALGPRRLFAPLRALVLDSRARAPRDAESDRGALRRAVGGHRSPARRAAALGAGARDPRSRRPHDAVEARRYRCAALAGRAPSYHRRPRPPAHPHGRARDAYRGGIHRRQSIRARQPGAGLLMKRMLEVRWEDPLSLAEAARAMSGMDFLRAMRDGKLPHPPICALMNYRLVEV